MEKIGIALARHLKSQSLDDGHTVPPPRPEARVREVRVPGQIKYTHTRQVQISPDVLERHRIAVVANNDTADAFRLLRTQVLMQMRQKGWQTLAITSANKGAGKSTLAMNLALSFAIEVDHTALLVDADLRDPDVSKMLELPASPGLADYLVGRGAIEDLLIHPCVGNLVVLPGGSPVANTSELLRSPMMADLVAEMRERYPDRLIVFDVPPILAGADTLALSAYVDATILVVEEGKTTPEDFERARDLLANSSVMGVVLNKSRNAASVNDTRLSLRSRLRAAWRGRD